MNIIERDCQDKILDILPNNPQLALKVMAQMVANMMLSIDDANFEDFSADVKYNIDAFKKEMN